MKILIVANNSTGLFIFRNDLIRELLRNNEVVALTPFNDKVAELKDLGIRLIETSMERRGMNLVKDFSLLTNYFRLIQQEAPDLVITYTIKPNLYAGIVCRLNGIPYVANITGLGTTFQRRGLLRKMVTVMYRFALKRAKAVFFENSQNMQVFFDEKIISKDQAVLLNGAGVNLERFQTLPYPEDTGEVRFLFIGRIMAEKGVNELLESMRMLRKNGLNCTVDVLGRFDENYSEKIKKAESEGWLKYHGYQSDVIPFIKNCHCFVLPSYHEGMANTNLECASSGRPVITSDIPGCKEAVIDGVSGLLCEPKSVDSLYEAMKRIVEMGAEDCKTMGLAGRKHMETVFDKKKVVKETLKHMIDG